MSKSPLGSGVRQSPGRTRANSSSQAGADVSGPTHDGWRREALEAVVDSCDDAIATLTLEGTVMTWNPAATEVFGLGSEEALGRDISKLMVPAELQPQLWQWLAQIAAGTEVRHEIRRRRRDGTELVVSIRGLPLKDRGGRVIGSAWIGRDAGGHGPRDGDEDRGADSQLWRQRIDRALGDDRLVFAAQPVVDIRSGEVDHYELTLRLRLEDRICTPAEFIAPAERSGQIRELDLWVVRHGLELAATRPIAINLSGRSLGSEGLLAEIERELAGADTAPERITFEITETAAADDLERAAASVQRLRSLGCRVALDDFGTGYGSFSYLSRVPANELKIDREFVSRLRFGDTDWRIVDAIVAVGRNLGMTVVGEGVEDEATLELLESLGVDLAQGYFLGRPQLVDESWGAE